MRKRTCTDSNRATFGLLGAILAARCVVPKVAGLTSVSGGMIARCQDDRGYTPVAKGWQPGKAAKIGTESVGKRSPCNLVSASHGLRQGKHPTHRREGELICVFLHEGVLCSCPFAKYAAASFRMSRSSVTRRSSALRRRTSRSGPAPLACPRRLCFAAASSRKDCGSTRQSLRNLRYRTAVLNDLP
jgi:hypothetical protein